MSDVDFGAIAAQVTERFNGEDAAAAAAPEPIETPAEAPAVETTETTEAPAAEAPAEVDAFDDEGVTSFDRDYVSKLRGEAADHRTKLREEQERWAEWNKTLDGLDADQQGLARELVSSILEGNLTRAVEIIGPDELAKVLNVTPEQVADAVEAEGADAPLTRADLDRELAEREAKQQTEREIKAVFDEAKKLGYNPEAKRGTAEFGRWVMLVQHATAAGSVEAGHKALEAAEAAERQRVIDEYVASRNPGSPAPAGASGAAAREPEGAWLEKEGNPLQAAMRRAMDRVGGDHSQLGG